MKEETDGVQRRHPRLRRGALRPRASPVLSHYRGYPAPKAEAILIRAEGSDEFDEMRALLTSAPDGLAGLTGDEAARVDNLTARIRLIVEED